MCAKNDNINKVKVSRRKILLFAGIAVIVACALGLGAWEYVSSAKDYKNVLAVQGKKTAVDENGANSRPDGQIPGSTTPASVDVKEEDPYEADRKNLTENSSAKDNTITLQFLGIDRTEERDKTLGVYRTDTIALARINLETKEITVLNIPRDTYAYIPLVNKSDKINHAYAFGSIKGDGVKSSIDTINNFIKYTTIDYYFTLDMEPIPEIVDALGGVELDVEIDMKSHGANLSKGFQLLDGNKAFDYIHWRYSEDGDIGRIKRQQKFFKAMYTKLKEKDQLLKAVELALSYNKYIKTNLSAKQLISLAVLAKDMPEGNTTFYTVPGTPRYVNNLWYWYPEEKKTDELLKKLFQ